MMRSVAIQTCHRIAGNSCLFVLTDFLLLFCVAFVDGRDAAASSPPDNVPTFDRPYHPPSIEIVMVVVSALLSTVLLSVYVCYYEPPDVNSPGMEKVQRGLEPAVIELLPMFAYSDHGKGTTMGKSTECVVCLREFDGGEIIRMLPKCNHCFHAVCIDVWLKSQATCPICRVNLLETILSGGDTRVLLISMVDEINNLVSHTRDRVVIPVAEEEDGDGDSIGRTGVRAVSTSLGFSTKDGVMMSMGKFRRSRSTGNTVVPTESIEKGFPIMVPEDVQEQTIAGRVSTADGGSGNSGCEVEEGNAHHQGTTFSPPFIQRSVSGIPSRSSSPNRLIR